MLVGGTGLIEDADDDDSFYRDALGMQILSNKTGAGVAAAVIHVLERRSIKEFYFVGTDAVSSNVGHLSGVVAYMRKHYDRPLLFVLRCGAHIIARTWKHMLEATGREATRSPIKRKADEATIPAELLAIEDLYYVEKKWPELRAAMQASGVY